MEPPDQGGTQQPAMAGHVNLRRKVHGSVVVTINLVSVLVDDAIALCRLQIGHDHLRYDFAKGCPRSPAQFCPRFAGIPDKGVHFGRAKIAWSTATMQRPRQSIPCSSSP